nr:hypothetical protein [Tanacetum cinerariifolium]
MTLKHEVLYQEVRKEKEIKVFGFKEAKKGGRIEAIDADEDITLVDVETQVNMDAELQGRIDQDVSATTKDVSTAEPAVFDDEEVTMTMAQTLIKIKAEKAKLFDEQISQRLHDGEIKKAIARDKQEKDDLERAQVLQKNLKKKPVSIAQARKNMIIYFKNMAGYKMEHFRGMTYDKVRPIFEMEYKKVQTLFKPDKDVEEPIKKRVTKETLLQESFKKLKAVEVSDETKTPSPKHQLSSPSAPNAPSKLPSTKETSLSFIDYTPKSPTSSTSPSANGYLNSPTSPPLRVPPPLLTHENASMDITLTLSPITPLDVQFNTPSPSPPILGHPILWKLLEAYGDSCLCCIHNSTLIFGLRDEL